MSQPRQESEERKILNIIVKIIRWIFGIATTIAIGLLTPWIQELISDKISIDRCVLCTTSSCYKQYSRLANQAKQKISHLHSDTPIRFPLGVNRPVTLKSGQSNSSQGWEAIGFISSRGAFEAITARDLPEMFDRHLEKIKTAQSSRVSEIDLIARNTQTGQISVLPNVDYISFFKDALNAALKSEVKTHNLNLPALQNRMRR